MLTIESVAQTIRDRILDDLSRIRRDLLAWRPDLLCSVGEQSNASVASWYLSVLVSRESDEVSATVVAKEDGGQVSIEADICLRARVIFESKESLRAEDDQGVEGIGRLLDEFSRLAPELIVRGVSEIEAT